MTPGAVFAINVESQVAGLFAGLHSTNTPPPGSNCAVNEFRSTAVGDRIVEFTDEELFVGFGSLVVEVTLAVFVAISPN